MSMTDNEKEIKLKILERKKILIFIKKKFISKIQYKIFSSSKIRPGSCACEHCLEMKFV